MEDDIGAVLQSVMSDPEQMAKFTSMAQRLMGGNGETAPAASAPAPSGWEGKLLSLLGKGLSASEKGSTSRSAALLTAMRPYMRPEKQQKLDSAMRIARMVHIAGDVMREMGGDGNGI